ncbi:MAG: phosphate/phosphite/phosphonate ABC transporter substrate-binding protein [Acidimicrobiia bacterium]
MGLRGVASLPMYPFPELRRDWDALWAAVHRRLPASRAALAWSDDAQALWHSPDLALSQACGWPLVTDLSGRVRSIGTFDPRIPDASGGRYRSVLVARRAAPLAELAGGSAAVNATDSLSGWISLLAAFRAACTPWHGTAVTTGAHVLSIEAVRDGRADVASIDAVTFALVGDLHPDALRGLMVVGRGPRVPCLPLIVPAGATDDEVALWRDALAAASTEPATAGARRRLRIRGFVPLDDEDYGMLARLAPVIDER